MAIQRFRNYTAASRKPFLLQFGMYMAGAGSDLSVIEDVELLTPVAFSGAQNGVNTTYTLSISPTAARVIKNGNTLSQLTDYTLSGNTLNMASPPTAIDILLIMDLAGLFVAGTGGGGGGGIGSVGDQHFIATQGQTVFAPMFAITSPWVFLNGVKQKPGVDYTVAANQVTFLSALDAGWDVEIIQ
jgi:hypothetical protein